MRYTKWGVLMAEMYFQTGSNYVILYIL
ncbi:MULTISPECIES: DUF6783 domain-containing protein [Robinsoniella]